MKVKNTIIITGIYLIFSVIVSVLFATKILNLPAMITGNPLIILLGPMAPLAFEKFFLNVYVVESAVFLFCIILAIHLEKVMKITLLAMSVLIWLLSGYVMSSIVY